MPVPTGSPALSFPMDVLRVGDGFEMCRLSAALLAAEMVDVSAVWDRPDPQLVSKAMGSDRAISAADLTVAMTADAASPYKASALSLKARAQSLVECSVELWGNGITPGVTCSSPSPVMRVAHPTGERLPSTFINNARAKVLGSHRVIVHLERSGV